MGAVVQEPCTLQPPIQGTCRCGKRQLNPPLLSQLWAPPAVLAASAIWSFRVRSPEVVAGTTVRLAQLESCLPPAGRMGRFEQFL
jgi:hypothetical protein